MVERYNHLIFSQQISVFYSVSKRHFLPRDCYDLLVDGNTVSGVYDVYPAKARKFVRVFCDMDGGWLVRTPTQSHIYDQIYTSTYKLSHTYAYTHKYTHYTYTYTNTHIHTHANTKHSQSTQTRAGIQVMVHITDQVINNNITTDLYQSASGNTI